MSIFGWFCNQTTRTSRPATVQPFCGPRWALSEFGAPRCTKGHRNKCDSRNAGCARTGTLVATDLQAGHHQQGSSPPPTQPSDFVSGPPQPHRLPAKNRSDTDVGIWNFPWVSVEDDFSGLFLAKDANLYLQPLGQRPVSPFWCRQKVGQSGWKLVWSTLRHPWRLNRIFYSTTMSRQKERESWWGNHFKCYTATIPI